MRIYLYILCMNRLLTLICLLCISTASTFALNISKEDADKELEQLDKEIAKRSTYINAREARIDSIRRRINDNISGPRLLELTMQIGDLYSSFNNDSAISYYLKGYNTAKEYGDSTKAFRFRVKHATILPLSGFINEAVQEYEAITPASLPAEELELYYNSGRQLYSYIASSFANYPDTYKYWADKVTVQRDSLLKVLKQGSQSYNLNESEALLERGELTKAKVVLIDLLDHANPNSNICARACHMLSAIAKANGNKDEQIYYLAKSAIADIKGAVREVMSLQELGVIMSENREIDRAYIYLSEALSSAVECNASMRIVQTSASLPLIQKAHSAQIESWRNLMYLVIACIIIILIILLITLLVLRKQMRKQSLLKAKIQSANQVKEIYISQFFRLCAMYIDKLNQFCKIANRKISLGQVDDLYKITKSGKLVEEQSEEFYKLFDDAFLHIYPTFIEDVNALLKEKIVLKEGELLNNDFRILAFMRLGLEDTNQVALILNYSVNTIYAYRNKLRNRAFDRDNFEKNIMAIGAINE